MDDLISRKAALDIFDDYNVDVEFNGNIEAYSRDRKRLCELPSAQPELFGTINHAGLEHPLSDEEIIPRLRQIQEQVGGSYVIDRAIELLTAQPVQCEDAVSRKAVIEITAETGALETQYRVKRLPPVTPKQRTGKWIPSDSQCGIQCPVCGVPVDDFCHSIDYIDLDYKPNFCPNCGAKMNEDRDYEHAVEQLEHNMTFEPTYNLEDGSM